MSAEFQVNTYEANWQRYPVLTVLADASVLVVWESYFNNYDDNPSATYIAAQRYSAAGVPIGGEQVVFVEAYSSADGPSVAALPDGGYVIAWVYDDYDDILTLDTDIRAQVFNANGSARTAPFLVSSNVPTDQDAGAPSIAVRGDGGFSIGYTGPSPANFAETYIRHYTAQGAALGLPQGLSTVSREFDETTVETATLADGRTISIWNSQGAFDLVQPGSSSNAIRGAIHNANGSVARADFHLTINIGSVGSSFGYQYGPGYDVAALSNGGFVVTTRAFPSQIGVGGSDSLIAMTFFNAAGNPTSGPQVAWSTSEVIFDTAVAQLASGEIVMVWEQYPLNGDISTDVYGRIFSANGVPVSPVFEVGYESDGNYFTQETPEVVALPGGGFMVAITSESIDIDDEGISATIYGRGTPAADILTVDLTGYLAGLAGNDRLTGDGAGNLIDGGAGNDTLLGQGGADLLTGGAGADTLDGGVGNDTLIGGVGNDRYRVDSTGDTVQGEIGFSQGGGIDTIESLASFTLPANVEVLRLEGSASINGFGNAAPESLVGNPGANRLGGGGGNDVLNGKAGNDTLTGGTGRDTLVGEAGADVFVYTSLADSYAGSTTRDFLNGFTHGQDRIDLSPIDANPFNAGDQAFTFIGSAAFSGAGSNSAGQLRYFTFGGQNLNILQADWNGDGVAEMEIFINGTNYMTGTDFIL